MGDGRKMEGKVRGAACGTADFHRIGKGSRRHNVVCLEVLPDEVHHGAARFFRELLQGRDDGADR